MIYLRTSLINGIFIILSLLFFSCENDIDVINNITSQGNFPIESSRNIETFYSDSAKIKIRLISPQMERYMTNAPYIEFPQGLQVEFFDKEMKVTTKLNANYAIRYEAEKRMEARRDVVVINEKGEMLNTEHLVWDEQTQKIYTDEFVKITTDKEIIYGDGLESNQDFTHYKIKNIKGTIIINHDE